MYLNARGDGEGTQGGSKFDIYFGGLTGDGNYTIQFDLAREFTDWRDYVALNMDGWDSDTIGRLDKTTKWTKSAGFLGSKGNAGDNGNSPRTYHTYTGTFKTLLNEVQLNFGVLGWGNMFIDNIVITDSTGTVVFSENFEGIKAPVVEPEIPDEPEEPEEDGIDFDYTYINGKAYKCPIISYIDQNVPDGTYAINGANASYVIVSNGESSSIAKLRSSDASNGTNSLRIRAGDTAEKGADLCTSFTIKFGEAANRATYEVSFDAYREHSDWRDFAAICYNDWNSASRLTGTTKWTVTELGVGNEIGGNGTGTWKRYTATFTTDIAPQLNFAVAGWGELHIDNIVIKDSEGNIVVSEGFEGGIPEVEEPEEPEVPEVPEETVSCTYLQGNYYELPVEVNKKLATGDYAIPGAKNGEEWNVAINKNKTYDPIAKIAVGDATNGNNSLYLNGNDNDANYGGAVVALPIGKLTGDGHYTVQFDLARVTGATDWRDYAALNLDCWNSNSRFEDGNTRWTKGASVTPTAGGQTWYTYTASYYTELPTPSLYFGAEGWGVMYIDNIVVKDSTGTVFANEEIVLSLNKKADIVLDGEVLAENTDKLVYSPKHVGEHNFIVKNGEKTTNIRIFVQETLAKLVEKRAEYIVNNQQYCNEKSPLCGAYLVFDTKEKIQYFDNFHADHNASRERIGMALLLAEYLKHNDNEPVRESLEKYKKFFFSQFIDAESGEVYNTINRDNTHYRLYNYSWAIMFLVDLYKLEGNEEYLAIMTRVIKRYYKDGGSRFYPNGWFLLETVECLKDAGFDAMAGEVLALYREHICNMVKIGTSYPKHEVNYEQTIVTPGATMITQYMLASGSREFLADAKAQVDILSRFNGNQPDYHLYETAIRHWDDFWFGKSKVYGDTFPHYWSSLTGLAYLNYYKLTDDKDYLEKAMDNIRNCLCLFFPDGGASCAYVYPYTLNGTSGEFYDEWANDQDFALYYYLKYLHNSL